MATVTIDRERSSVDAERSRTHEVTREGVHLVYDDIGTGPAVLFSHCWLFDARQWPQAAAVARAGYRVLNLDNRGHGRSGPYDTRHTLWDVADDLIAVLDDAGEERAVLVGLSLGGYAALRAALRHPSRVRALVLAATTGGVLTRSDRLKARALLPLIPSPARSLLAPILPGVLFGPTARRTQPGLIAGWRRQWLAQMARAPRSMAATGQAALISRDDITSELGRISVPTLVIAGEEETYLAASARMAARIPGARLVVFPDTGHLSALESPRPFETALIAFLHELDPPAQVAATVGNPREGNR